MSEIASFEDMTASIVTGLRAKLGVRSKDLHTALLKSRRRLPRRIYQQGMTLVAAADMADHPRLSQTLNKDALWTATTEVTTYLETIDLADKRKGMFLGALGGLVFNLFLMAAVLGGFLYWHGNP